MKKLTTDSQGMYFIRSLWRGLSGRYFTDVEVCDLVKDAFAVACKAKMKFSNTDLYFINSFMKDGTLMKDNKPNDLIYAIACAYSNISACKSFEKFAKIKPYMLELKRVYVGVIINWEGREYSILKITKEGLILRTTTKFYKSYPDTIFTLSEWKSNISNIQLIKRIQY